MNAAQVFQEVFHFVRKREVCGAAIGVERIAADRRHNVAIKNGRGRRFFLKGIIRVPATAKV